MVVFHQHDEEQKQPGSEWNAAFLIAVSANGLFVVLQIIFAYITNSTSLLADGVHNLGDVLSLVLAWVANSLLKRRPTQRSTYGMKKTSILASFANGALLLFTCGVIATEAIYKLFSPTEVHALGVMIVASIGILVNGATAMLFMRGSEDLNIRVAFLHLAYDALISLGVVLSSALLYWTGWLWLDPLVGILIAVIILKGTWFLFADSFRMIIDGVPRGISIAKVRQRLEEQKNVQEAHDLHIWALSTQENALSVHLWMPDAPLSDEEREKLNDELRSQFNIHHTTIQVERTQLHCADTCKAFI